MRKYPNLNVLYKMGSDGAMYFDRDRSNNEIKDYMDFEMQISQKIDKSKSKINNYYQEAYSFSDYKDIHLVDTTGAGDSFTGAFTVALAEGMPI